MRYPDYLTRLASLLKRLPGVGSKAADRLAFELTRWPKERLDELSTLLANLKASVCHCPECGALVGSAADKQRCAFCDEKRAESAQICIVAQIRDLFLIEETREFKGLYHVVTSHFHPQEGRTFHRQSIEKLKERILKQSLQEVILAFDATEEGDALALFLKKELSTLPIRLTRLAFGIPLGSSFDFIDGATLARSLSGRQNFSK